MYLKNVFAFFTVWTGPKPLVLQMISRAYIKLAMDSLKDEPRTHQVLIMAGEREKVTPEVEALRRSKMMDIDVDANCIYGFTSQGHLFQLLEYGQINGGFIPRVTQMCGACMFHALRKGMKCHREFTLILEG